MCSLKPKHTIVYSYAPVPLLLSKRRNDGAQLIAKNHNSCRLGLRKLHKREFMKIEPLRICLFLFALLVLSCTNDLGSPCRSTDDCNARCLTGDSFPGGFCTEQCDISSDCPEEWSCVKKEGGVCLPNCESSAICTDELGPRWECDKKKLQTGGERRVCIGR